MTKSPQEAPDKPHYVQIHFEQGDPVEVDGQFYWDGGLVSNTPLQYVIDQPKIGRAHV